MNKIFLVFEKFNKIPLLGLYFSREKLATYFFFKIKSEIKSIINFLFKKNQIISTIYKILTYYQFSTLNSEIKIGKTKKFIFEFLKLKKKKILILVLKVMAFTKLDPLFSKILWKKN